MEDGPLFDPPGGGAAGPVPREDLPTAHGRRPARPTCPPRPFSTAGTPLQQNTRPAAADPVAVPETEQTGPTPVCRIDPMKETQS